MRVLIDDEVVVQIWLLCYMDCWNHLKIDFRYIGATIEPDWGLNLYRFCWYSFYYINIIFDIICNFRSLQPLYVALIK